MEQTNVSPFELILLPKVALDIILKIYSSTAICKDNKKDELIYNAYAYLNRLLAHNEAENDPS